jgi:FkbM family methyltransferase
MTIQLDLNSSRFFRGLKNLQRLPELFICFQQIENWSEFIGRYLSIPSKTYPFSIRTRNNLILNLKDFCDVTTAWVVFCKQEYKVNSEHKVIVDLGANIGTFALFAARQSQDAKVICFEPFPDTFQQLKSNFKNNGLDGRIVCRQLAVSGSNLPRVMAPGGFGNTTSYLLESVAENEEVLNSVFCITFADLLEEVAAVSSVRTIDLLKMDIEGAEYEFLENVPAESLSTVREIQMEYHACGSKEKLFDKLRDAGLVCTVDWVFGDNYGVAHFKRIQ